MNRISTCMLRSGLLIFFTLCGCSRTPSAVEQVKQVGGKVTIDEKSPDHAVIVIDLKKDDLNDAWLEHLEPFPKLRTLILSHTEITDAGLVHLQRLTQLETLDLRQTGVTGLQRLQGLTQLETLELGETRLTDAGLEPAKGFARLQSLNLRSTKISDAGLEHSERTDPPREVVPQLHGHF